MNANDNQNPTILSQGRPTKRPRTTKKSSQAVQAQTPSEARELPPQEQPQQVQHFTAGPANGHPRADAAVASQGPVNQAGQENVIPMNNLNQGGSTQTHQPNELVNHNVAPSQPTEPNKPTPEEVSQMQYNLLFGPVLKQPEVPSQPQISSSSQAGADGNLSREAVLDPALWGDSPMDFTYQAQGQPTQTQPVQNQSAEVQPAQQAVDDDDMFGDIDFEKQLELELEKEFAGSLEPAAEFNSRN